MSRTKTGTFGKPAFKVGDIISNGSKFNRKIWAIHTNYLNTPGRIGYWYEDGLLTHGLISEESLKRWGKKINNLID